MLCLCWAWTARWRESYIHTYFSSALFYSFHKMFSIYFLYSLPVVSNCNTKCSKWFYIWRLILLWYYFDFYLSFSFTDFTTIFNLCFSYLFEDLIYLSAWLIFLSPPHLLLYLLPSVLQDDSCSIQNKMKQNRDCVTCSQNTLRWFSSLSNSAQNFFQRNLPYL